MEKWLITGGAGFIGSNFLYLISQRKGLKIHVLDSLTYAGNLGNIKALVDGGKVEFIKGDICDSELVFDLFRKHEFSRVVHFAAESHVDRSILGALPFIQTNIQGTFNLLEAARKTWTKSKNHLFLHVSTDEVFGSLLPADPSFGENSQYSPNSPYSASKAASDHLARAWHKTYQLPVVISHCSNNYGPWQFPEKLIPLVILNALEGKELPVYGDGLQIRDWLFVEDHCHALLVILEKGKPGEKYFIGGGYEETNLEIVRTICEKVDELIGRRKGTSLKLIKHVKDRPGHDRRYAIDWTKINRELGWKPRSNFQEKIGEVIKWYRDHKDWADSIRSGEYLRYYKTQYKVES